MQIGDWVEPMEAGIKGLGYDMPGKRIPNKFKLTYVSSDGEHVGVKIGRQSYALSYPAIWFKEKEVDDAYRFHKRKT